MNLLEDFVVVRRVYTENGRKHIEFDTEDYLTIDQPFTFIEGIGPNLGIFYFGLLQAQIGYFCLTCFANDQEFYLQERSHSGPQLCVNGLFNASNNIEASVFKIINEQQAVKLIFPDEEVRDIQIFNLTGTLIFKSTQHTGSEMEIQESILPKGCYIIQVDNINSKNTHTLKIVI